MQKNILLKVAARVLLKGLEEVPGAGAIIKMGREGWQALREAQEDAREEERVVQLEQAAAITPQEARSIAQEAVTEMRHAGQTIDVARAEAVQDIMTVMPAQIRERTRATLDHARRLGTQAVAALPVTNRFNDVEQESFYTNLFPQRRPQFHNGDVLPHGSRGWQLERLIGAGGFGEVWLARKAALAWAVKFCQDETSAALLKRESKTLNELQQKLPAGTAHIAALLDFQLDEMPYWLAFEYVEGGTLESRIRLGPMDWPTAWNLFEPILQGMAMVHELNIVHRDLKPANILLDKNLKPRIADFGIGKVMATQVVNTQQAQRSQSMTTRGYGSLGYMSPEQASGNDPAHATDDVYALGVILWQMLTGQLTSLSYIDDIKAIHAPKEIKKAIAACVFYPRARRPANAQLLLKQIYAGINAEKIQQQTQLAQPQQQAQQNSQAQVEQVLQPHIEQQSVQKQPQVGTKSKTNPIRQVKSRPKVTIGAIFGVIALIVVGVAVRLQFAVRPSSSQSGQQQIGSPKIDTALQAVTQGHKYYQAQNYAEAAKWYSKAAEQGNIRAQSNLGVMYENGQGVPKDETEAATWYRKAAEQGDVDTQGKLGWMYQSGQGVPKNEAEAINWYRKAAEQGHAVSQGKLGFMYAHGQGVPKDDAEAITWYRKAANQGNADAQAVLGGMYYDGRGVPKDEAEAAKWYRKAAEQGNVSSQYLLGAMYLEGKGVTKDYAEAAKWFLKAAEQGLAPCQSQLGALYINGIGVKQDYAEAFKWCSKAAAQNDARGQYLLGAMYYNGQGVAEDKAEAIKWFRKSAEQGYAEAKETLKKLDTGSLPSSSQSGQQQTHEDENNADLNAALGTVVRAADGYYDAQNYAEAAKWYRKAAEFDGQIQAQARLASMYDKGQGVTQDDTEAAKWYRKVAEQGNFAAQFLVGAIYFNGKGVTKDNVEAAKWFFKSAELGYAPSQSMLGTLYFSGVGVIQDYAEAFKWCSKAATQDDAHGQYCLGAMYYNGQGVANDKAEAIKWFRKSAAQGYAEAKKQLKEFGMGL